MKKLTLFFGFLGFLSCLVCQRDVSIDLTVVKRVIDSVGKVAEELTQVDDSAGHKPEGRDDSGDTRNDDDGDMIYY